MGSPEFPGDENERQHNFQPPPGHALPMHGIIAHSDEEMDSDDSVRPGFQEAETGTFDPTQPYAAEGYHPLHFDVMTADDEDSSESEDEDDAGADDADTDSAIVASSEEPIENTAEREILREVWNAPRPSELDITIDSNKAEEIKSVMSNVSLGLASIKPPDWALNVPESQWIADLLQDVRNKAAATSSTN